MTEDNKKTKSLIDWLGEFYEDTSKISEIIRNLSFAGIGLIWIFKNTDPAINLIPMELHFPLTMLVLTLLFDLVQLLWRSIAIYINYRIKEAKFLNKKMSSEEINDVTMPRYISNVTWIFFITKIVCIIIAYFKILEFMMQKI